ncbi:alcohol dehydrogenase catalytic domain-containing protein [Gordonia sp. PKS22-38]|uniref:alcohol dehydrogenase n=1 Tax=Gordonia prachuapensis TaxID=3115651 RepID=A0ABU7MVC6_9ACTN|nr:alcohol dehydrogenase catalytic domain-containing protein [Gordonia sp. PKS22-38]
MNSTMLAVQLVEWRSGPQLREVPVPTPSGAEVLVAVEAAGLCHTDIRTVESGSELFGYELPMTLGHEVCGTVVQTARAADAQWLGRRVVVHGIWGCGECRNCVRGRENYCLRLGRDSSGRHLPIGGGLGHDGGLAQAMVVPSVRHLVPAGDLTPAQSAPMADAGLTAYHAINECSDLIDPSTVAAVIGVGGLGHLAVQILRDLGAGTVVAVDNRDQAVALAREVGAHRAGRTLPEALGPAADADLIFDFVGSTETMTQARSMLAPGGRLSVVGGAGGRLEVGKSPAVAPGWSVSAPFWGSVDELSSVVAIGARGGIRSEVTCYGLDRAIEAFDQLRAGEVTGRVVLLPPALSYATG